MWKICWGLEFFIFYKNSVVYVFIRFQCESSIGRSFDIVKGILNLLIFFFFFRSLVLRSCLLSNKITSRYVKLNIVLRRFISRIKRNIAYCLKRWRWHWSHRKFSACFLHAIFNFCIKRIFFRIFFQELWKLEIKPYYYIFCIKCFIHFY